MLLKLIFRALSSKVIASSREAVECIKSGSTIAIGGFGNSGSPENLLTAVSNSFVSDLTLILSECGIERASLSSMIKRDQVKKIITSAIGENESFNRLYYNGEIELEISPLGTLIEKLRAGGAGIPAFYTPAGHSTQLSEGSFAIRYRRDSLSPAVLMPAKETRNINGKNCVLEFSYRPDFSLVKAWKGDTLGNLVYRGSAQNLNPEVAMAGKTTIAEVEHLVDAGEISPAEIHTPGIYVHRIVKGEVHQKKIERLTLSVSRENTISGKKEQKYVREKIIRRAIEEIRPGMYVGLGNGIPTYIPNFISPTVQVIFHSDNGILGVGPYPRPGKQDFDLINVGKETVSVVPGAAFLSSLQSISVNRGSRMDLNIYGALQVSKDGDIANWLIPEKLIKGVGGTMDALSSDTKCIVLMEHTMKNLFKIKNECEYPVTARKVVNKLITDIAVFEFEKDRGIVLTELYKGISVDYVRAHTECKFEVSSNLKTNNIE